jgi:hypothetical protein
MRAVGAVSFVDEAPVDALSLPPGGELAAALDLLIPFAMDDGELIDALKAFRRLTSWAQAGELAVIAELARRRPAGAHERLANGSSFAGEFLVDEVAAALTLTGVSAAYLVELALALSERLPGTFEALRAGLIDQAKAKVVAQGTAAVAAQVATQVEERVLEDAPAQTTSQLRSKVARAVIAADPDAADKRRKAAEAQRDVHCQEERDGSGTATISGRHLPADQAVAAANRLNAIARAFKADGDTRRLGAIRADVLLAMMLGLLPAELQPHSQPEDLPPHGTADDGVPPATSMHAPGDDEPQTPPDHTEPGPLAAHPPTKLLPQTPPGHNENSPVGGADRSAHSDGYGATGSPAEDTAPPQGRDDEHLWQDPHHDSYDPGEFDERDGPGPAPWYETAEQDLAGDPYEQGDDLPARREAEIAARAGARVGTVNLTIPLTTYLGLTQNPAEIPGYGPLLAEVARILADSATGPGTAWCITVLDDQGRPIQHGETRYRPGPALRRKIEARNPVCVFPQCRRPARACDLDHTVPYGHDQGVTCGCNIAPLCRRHHRLKQSEGWRLDQFEPGHYLWTTPSGKRHHVGPEEQPL